MHTTLTGKFIEEARRTAGIKRKELGIDLGYSSGQFVYNWEKGKSRPPVQKVMELAKRINLDLSVYLRLLTYETSTYDKKPYKINQLLDLQLKEKNL